MICARSYVIEPVSRPGWHLHPRSTHRFIGASRHQPRRVFPRLGQTIPLAPRLRDMPARPGALGGAAGDVARPNKLAWTRLQPPTPYRFIAPTKKWERIPVPPRASLARTPTRFSLSACLSRGSCVVSAGGLLDRGVLVRYERQADAAPRPPFDLKPGRNSLRRRRPNPVWSKIEVNDPLLRPALWLGRH